MTQFVTIEPRKKVTKACDYCKKRKYKCSGVAPCDLCTKKKIPCQFSIVDRRTTKGNQARDKNDRQRRESSSSTVTAVSVMSTNTPAQRQNSKPDIPLDDQLIQHNKLIATKMSGYIPKSLQPLLSFPLEKDKDGSSLSSTNDEDDEEEEEEDEEDEGLSNDSGKSTRLLFDTAGNLRYIGESSPLSLLFESRNIFTSTIGESEFTGDPQGVNIIDGTARINVVPPMQLPRRDHCNVMIKFFENNINQTWYIFDMKDFKLNIVDYIYENPIRAPVEKLSLLHLVFSLGLLFAEKANSYLVEEMKPAGVTSTDFFESGFNLMRNIIDDGKLWLSQAYFLVYFYYQSTSKRSTSFLMLSTAIRNAQTLGLHRKFINESFRDQNYVTHRRKLWKSLYICDRISSILLGRPLLISDYDWDDTGDDDDTVYAPDGMTLDIQYTSLNYNARIAIILGKIIQNFYIDGIVDLLRAERIAIDLKTWSINLPSAIQIDKILDVEGSTATTSPVDNPLHKVKSDNYGLLLIHMSQLYGIILLSKPFFMYLLFKRNKNESPNKRSKQEAIMSNFCAASIKSSVLMIQLIHFFKEHNPHRMESYVLVNCCFMASLILGLTILYRQTNVYEPDEFTIDILAEKLMVAKSILLFYSEVSATAARFHTIVTKMYRALENAFKKSHPFPQALPQHLTFDSPESVTSQPQFPIKTPAVIQSQLQSPSSFPHTFEIATSTELEHLMNFQQFFVPSVSNSVITTNTEKRNELDAFMYNIGINDLLFEGAKE
ncbi:uncharacterized protein SPAPADRAFT_146579 [Spathaspora passalidarum NRRL Y-27907]|uniref:Zn(2)-C6 fungal-type domain-containing protein n=1 Tax=Spathaspora passalidarum (strain NRRL Y-27907 / 11-Y1) TaxID=619300 RepID=G3AGQ8_SPAPN|nr:uncharacterized protein SPAPADRAFT_146579 [Spathaspora passalidarum NRRL Y-27907]EGW35390.1 hypothetical protein SPAPADRAFT_146579 [Spathaspora passalidarum NRRL Y-27907]